MRSEISPTNPLRRVFAFLGANHGQRQKAGQTAEVLIFKKPRHPKGREMLSESLQDALQRAHENGYKEGFAAGWTQARDFPDTSLDVALKQQVNG